MKQFVSILLGLVVSSSALLAQTSAQQYVNIQVGQEPLKGSNWGIFARDASGKVLASHNAGIRLMPASNRKLITTGVMNLMPYVVLGADCEECQYTERAN